MQLACPFCRRKPDHKTLSRYNPQALALGGVQEAIADRGWFYAWCLSCGFAKRVFERVCVNGDRLPHVQDFRCEECRPTPAEKGPVRKPDGIVHTQECPNCGVTIEKVRAWQSLLQIILERTGLRRIAMPICRRGMVDVSMTMTMTMTMTMISLFSKALY
jgi:hypothetical protein